MSYLCETKRLKSIDYILVHRIFLEILKFFKKADKAYNQLISGI